MSSPWRIALLAAALVAAPLAAQQLPVGTPPTTDQARRLLETRPDLVAQLRREIANSGLTPDQVRARLRAAGYPDDLLDQYLVTRGTDSTRDSLSTALPSSTVLDAVAALGIMDTVDTAEIRDLLRRRAATPRSAAGNARDTSAIARDSLGGPLRTDSTAWQTVVDSLGRLVVVPVRASVRTARTVVDTGQTIFGLNVFVGATTQFDPNLLGPVDANYRLGPGDRLVLMITGDAERAMTLDITREGFIIVPGVGELPAANLTMDQLETLLYSRLGRVYSGLRRGADATTHFSINLARLHSNQVFVLGDVEQPGSYRISSAGTALTALYAAGGPTKNGGMRRIEIRRGGRVVDTLDLYDYLLRADGSHDPRLQSGDVVFVPVHGPRVRAYGELVRPGTYELRRGESLADIVHAAGGFTAEAARRRLQVSRILPPNERDSLERARVVVDVSAGTDGEPPRFPIEPGDVLRVFRVADRVSRKVTVRGHVGSPGAVGFTTGMHLSDALRLAGGLQPDAYHGEVLVSRLSVGDSTRVQLRTSLSDASRPADDLTLSDDDEVRVFSLTELRGPQFIVITGAVRRPGRYPYRQGMTLRDATLLAGGLDERASLSDAEITRVPAARDGSRLATTQRVALDSTYMPGLRVEGAPRALGIVQAGSAREIALEPYDNVLIPVLEDRSRPRRVVVAGEVRAPGTYVLLSTGERLSDVMQRAGGLTTSANSDGIVFYRRQDRAGRIGVNLARVLHDQSATDNLVLQDGDSIFLPKYAAIVQVQGAVNAPRGVVWVPGENLDYYVRAAGGATHEADVSHSYVTQPDGNVESVVVRRMAPNAIPVPRAGSTVFVAQRDQKERTDSVARLGVLAQVLGGLVALVALLRQR